MKGKFLFAYLMMVSSMVSAQEAASSFDISPVTDVFSEISAAVATIGGLVLGVVALIAAFRWVRRAAS
jgi:uncharacterized membrane protein